MADSKELKPKSFRIDEETYEKIKGLMKDFSSQNEAIHKMVEAYEFQQGKAILIDKKADIEQFEKYVACLTRMFMQSLEDNQNASELIRTEFDALLKSKDATIQDLQGQVKAAKELKEESTKKAKSFADENARLNEYIKSKENEYITKIDDMESMLADKDNLNKALTDSCNSLKSQVESMKADCLKVAELESLQKQYDKLLATSNALQADLSKQKQKYEQSIEEMKKHETEAVERVREQSQIVVDKAVLDLEKKYQKEIYELKMEKQKEVDQYQKKYSELLRQLEQRNSYRGQNNGKNNNNSRQEHTTNKQQ